MKRKNPTLDYAKSKAAWAEIHLKKLNRYVRRFLTKPYAISEEDDIENSRHIIRIKLLQIPDEIALVLGDFAYALRSGLDQLAWQLSLLKTDKPGRDTCFPIHERKDIKSENRFRQSVWDIPCSAVEEIKELQPYNRGENFRDHPLWQLNRLGNIDKHQIFAIGATDFNFNFGVPWLFTRELNDETHEVIFDISLKDQVDFKPGILSLVYGEPIDSSEVRLAIRDSEIAAIYQFVRDDVIPRFTRFFPKAPNP